MKLTLLLLSLLSFAALSNDYKPNMEELKLNKIKETKKAYSAGEKVPYKRVSNASRLSNIEVKGITNTNREQNLKRYIELNKVENEDPTQLKIALNYLEPKLKDPNKYKIKSVNYHFGDGNIQNTTLSNINGADFLILDISTLAVGSYTASIELVIQKNEDLRASGNKNKSGSDFKPILLTYSVDFEKVDSAFLVVNEYLRPEGLWAIGLDLSESYSEGGEILNYKVETFFEGELDFSATITFNRFSISFFEVGKWKIVITMTDTLGDTDTKELIYNVTNARPNLVYNYTFSEEFLGAIDIDMSESSDDGGEIVEYATFFLNDGQFSNYDSHGPQVTRQLLRSGTNTICLRVVDNQGVDRVSCFDVTFEGEILPIYFLNSIDETGFDPRFYFVDNACAVPAGRELKEIVLEYNNGVDFLEVRTQEEYFDLFIPTPGVWNITAYCVDNTEVQSNVINYELNAEFDLGRPEAYVELGPLPLAEDPSQKIYATIWENSMPSPFANYIAQYNYNFKNLDTNETFSESRGFAYGDIFFPSYGKWEVTYTVIDDLGLVSDPFTFTVDIIRPLIAPTLNSISLQNQNGDDPASLNYRVSNIVFSQGSAPITEYLFNFTKAGTGESFSLTPTQPYIAINFPSFGEWTLEFKIKNGDNLFSESVFETINIEKALPTLSISLNPLAEDITGLVYALSVDNFDTGSGTSITNYDFNFVETNKNLSFNFNTTTRFNDIEFPDGGIWIVTYTATNDLGDSSELQTLSLTVTKINQVPVASFSLSNQQNDPTTVNVVSFSQDPDGEIESYNFSATNYETYETIEKSIVEDGSRSFNVALDYGSWNINITAIDSDGAESDPYTTDFTITNSKPIASFIATKEEGFGNISINSLGSYDPDGFITNYFYTFTNKTSGTVVEYSTIEQIFNFNLSEIGEWEIKLEITDNLMHSDIVYQLISIDRDDFSAIVSNKSKYEYQLEISELLEGESLDVSISRPDGSILLSGTFTQTLIPISDVNINGTYLISLNLINNNQILISKNLEFTQDLPAIGDDIIPEIPNEDLNQSLLGIDSDKDGLRDDVELKINELFTDLKENTNVKEYAKTIQEQIKYSNNIEFSKIAIKRSILRDYCLNSLDIDNNNFKLNQVKLITLNNKDRLFAYLRAQMNAKGLAIAINIEKEDYAKLCN